jgi:predicted GH43/DUF377 family glycosyl hydrolase
MAKENVSSLFGLRAYGSKQVVLHGNDVFGDQLGARDPWVWEHNGVYFMHYDAAGPSGWLAALATSIDGENWEKHGPVLSLGKAGEVDSGSASYGTVFFDGADWHMFYLGTPNAARDGYLTPSFPYATLKASAPSPYGPWLKQRGVRPFVPEEGSWYDDTASPGQVIRYADGFVMLFSAATTIDGQIKRTLGLAHTDDLAGTWTVDAEPLLPLDEQIENSSLYFEEESGLWFLFTNHVGVATDKAAVSPQGSPEYTDAIWVYWSDDPTNWNRENRAVVLDSKNSEWSPRVVGLPSVLVLGDKLAIYFDGSTRDAIDHGLRDVGVAFLDLPLVPPSE